jgi:hypothetical protein
MAWQGISQSADFSMRGIGILRSPICLLSVPIELDHKDSGGFPVKSENPFSVMPSRCQENLEAPPSRLLDEKASDDSGAEATTDSALAPAGLKNPFWSKAS